MKIDNIFEESGNILLRNQYKKKTIYCTLKLIPIQDKNGWNDFDEFVIGCSKNSWAFKNHESLESLMTRYLLDLLLT